MKHVSPCPRSASSPHRRSFRTPHPLATTRGVVKAARKTGVRGSALAVLLALATHADAHGECFPTQQALADLIGVSTRTVRRASKKLEAHKVITRRQLPPDPRGPP